MVLLGEELIALVSGMFLHLAETQLSALPLQRQPRWSLVSDTQEHVHVVVLAKAGAWMTHQWLSCSGQVGGCQVVSAVSPSWWLCFRGVRSSWHHESLIVQLRAVAGSRSGGRPLASRLTCSFLLQLLSWILCMG